MSDRTAGATRNCGGCRYWSEMMAQVIGGGPVQAACLSGTGPYAGKYTTARMTCATWREGSLGAIDTPEFDGTEYEAT